MKSARVIDPEALNDLASTASTRSILHVPDAPALASTSIEDIFDMIELGLLSLNEALMMSSATQVAEGIARMCRCREILRRQRLTSAALGWYQLLPSTAHEHIIHLTQHLREIYSKNLKVLYPKEIRSASTPDKRFNEIQAALVMAGTFPREQKFQYWLIYFILMLASPRMAIDTALRECITHSRFHERYCSDVILLFLDQVADAVKYLDEKFKADASLSTEDILQQYVIHNN